MCIRDRTDDFQHTLVMDTDFPERLEQQAVIDIVEASLDVTLNSPHGLVGRFTSSISDIDDTPD